MQGPAPPRATKEQLEDVVLEKRPKFRKMAKLGGGVLKNDRSSKVLGGGLGGVAPKVSKASLSGRELWATTPPQPSSTSVPPPPPLMPHTCPSGISGKDLTPPSLPTKRRLCLPHRVTVVPESGSTTPVLCPWTPGVVAAAAFCSLSLLAGQSHCHPHQHHQYPALHSFC